MSGRSLALVANFHRERRIGRKTANFLGHVAGRLRDRGIQFNIEFVLDRPDDATVDCIERSAQAIAGARVHVVDFGNLGVSRTFGVQQARASVVCFTDGDDFFSLNWFEGALDHFSSGRREEVLHTQHMVGFDHEEFIRETTDSTDPSFDPLALAVDWYWSANLAVQTDVFALSPIEPYDHAGGFGSEDWHWTCNSLAKGIARVSLPGTAYYYRVKPERFALGRIADVIHLPSPLFAARSLPEPATAAEPAPVAALTADFFARAREIERFELGVSYLRSVEAGGKAVRHFKPHTPPIAGKVYRGTLEAGFGDGSVIVFADLQRLPGGLGGAAALCDALTGGPSATRLYIVDGTQEPSHAREDGFVISLGELRSANLYAIQIDRLVARFMIQHRRLTVLNLLSSRMPSRALAFSRASCGGVDRWINLVTDHGFDALSQAWDELDLYRAAGIASENIAVFEKTVIEARAVRGVELEHAPELERAFVSGSLASMPGAVRATLPAKFAATLAAPPLEPPSIEARLVRVRSADRAEASGGVGPGPWLQVGPALIAIADKQPECILVGGDAFLGAGFPTGDRTGPAGLRIPALTIVHRERQPTSYVRHRLESWNDELRSARAPADLASVGVIGVDCAALRDLLADHPAWISIPALLARCIRRSEQARTPAVGLFGRDCVVSTQSEHLQGLGGPGLLRGLNLALNAGAAGG